MKNKTKFISKIAGTSVKGLYEWHFLYACLLFSLKTFGRVVFTGGCQLALGARTGWT